MCKGKHVVLFGLVFGKGVDSFASTLVYTWVHDCFLWRITIINETYFCNSRPRITTVSGLGLVVFLFQTGFCMIIVHHSCFFVDYRASCYCLLFSFPRVIDLPNTFWLLIECPRVAYVLWDRFVPYIF